MLTPSDSEPHNWDFLCLLVTAACYPLLHYSLPVDPPPEISCGHVIFWSLISKNA